MPIQCQTPTNGNTFYWYLKDDKIIPMTNNDVNATGWSRPYRRLIQQAAWEFVFAGGNNGVTITALSIHLDPQQPSFAPRLIGIMEQCQIWTLKGNMIFRNPAVQDFEQSQQILQEYHNNMTNHVPVGQVQPVLPIHLAPATVIGQGNRNNGQKVDEQPAPPVQEVQHDIMDQDDGDNAPTIVQQRPAQAVGHKATENNHHHNQRKGTMPTDEQITVLATDIANYLIEFASIDDDGIDAEMSMDEKLNRLYKWPMCTVRGINYGRIQNLELHPDVNINADVNDTNNRATATIKFKNALHVRLNEINAIDAKIQLLRRFVRDWGKIKEKGKKDRTTEEDIAHEIYHNNRFIEWIDNSLNLGTRGTLNNEKPFDRIASWSKVACILDPTKYAIYDSRVARSLNYIIYFKSELRGREIYFSEPPGRNQKIAIPDDRLNRIFRLNNDQLENVFLSNQYETINGTYKLDINKKRKLRNDGNYAGYRLNLKLIGEDADEEGDDGDENDGDVNNNNIGLGRRLKSILCVGNASPKDAYQRYINLLQKISVNLFGDDDTDRLQKTEMLLFALADHKELFIPVIKKLQNQGNPIVP